MVSRLTVQVETRLLLPSRSNIHSSLLSSQYVFVLISSMIGDEVLRFLVEFSGSVRVSKSSCKSMRCG